MMRASGGFCSVGKFSYESFILKNNLVFDFKQEIIHSSFELLMQDKLGLCQVSKEDLEMLVRKNLEDKYFLAKENAL